MTYSVLRSLARVVLLAVLLVGVPADSAAASEVLTATLRQHTLQALKAQQSNMLASASRAIPASAASFDPLTVAGPGLVRIITHVMGSSTLRQFDLDWSTSSVRGVEGGEEITFGLDEYYTGSGFIVTPTGHILTSSHQVTDTADRAELAYYIVEQIFDSATLDDLSAADLRAIEARVKMGESIEDIAYKLGWNLAEWISNELTPVPVSVYVVTREAAELAQQRRGMPTESLYAEIARKSLPAIIVRSNPDYPTTGDDLALIKIEAENLPTLALADTKVAGVGTSVLALGFPGNTDHYEGELGLTPTLTNGTINALKQPKASSYKYLQTDAKIAAGSSGGPLLNEQGEVIGMIVQSTSTEDRGDNFAFAVPVETMRDLLVSAGVTVPTAATYADAVRAGLSLKESRRCKAALEQFTAAAGTSALVSDVAGHLDPHTEACQALIASGQSIDTRLDEVRAWVTARGWVVWAGAGGVLVLIIAIAALLFALRARRASSPVISSAPTPVSPMPSPQPTPPAAPYQPVPLTPLSGMPQPQ